MTTTIGARNRLLSPEVVRQAPRDVEILRLHARGRSYKEIATRFGYANPSGPQKRVARLQQVTALELDPFYWSLEIYRLEDLLSALHFDDAGPGVSARRQLAASKLMRNIIGFEVELAANRTVFPDRRQPVQGIDVDTVLQLAETEPTDLWTEALQLRAKGHRFATIAAHIGLSGKGAATNASMQIWTGTYSTRSIAIAPEQCSISTSSRSRSGLTRSVRHLIMRRLERCSRSSAPGTISSTCFLMHPSESICTFGRTIPHFGFQPGTFPNRRNPFPSRSTSGVLAGQTGSFYRPDEGGPGGNVARAPAGSMVVVGWPGNQ